MSVNLLYIANARMPTEKAHGLQIAKMCEAFAKKGATVTLLIPTRELKAGADIFSYYGVERNFEVVTLPVKDTVRSGKVGYLLQSIRFAFRVRRYLDSANPDIIYTRDLLPALASLNAGKNVCLEIHAFPNWSKKRLARVLKHFTKIVSTNRYKKEKLIELGIPEQRIAVFPNGVDETAFNELGDASALKRELGLGDKPVALYAGHLYDWKGAHVAYIASRYAPSVTFVLLGGKKTEHQALSKSHGDAPALMLEQVPHSLVAKYLHASDVLLLPNVATNEESEYETSPIKMFAYMASGVPIVASRLPSIKEILDDSTATFVTPGEPKELAEAVLASISSRARGDKAREMAREYTWGKRAEGILAFVKQ